MVFFYRLHYSLLSIYQRQQSFRECVTIDANQLKYIASLAFFYQNISLSEILTNSTIGISLYTSPLQNKYILLPITPGPSIYYMYQ